MNIPLSSLRWNHIAHILNVYDVYDVEDLIISFLEKHIDFFLRNHNIKNQK